MPRVWRMGLASALLCASGWAADDSSPLSLIEQGTAAIRSNPEEARQDGERALDALSRNPDVDLEIRARLLLCDYYSERDGGAAQRQIDAANLLLPKRNARGLGPVRSSVRARLSRLPATTRTR